MSKDTGPQVNPQGLLPNQDADKKPKHKTVSQPADSRSPKSPASRKKCPFYIFLTFLPLFFIAASTILLWNYGKKEFTATRHQMEELKMTNNQQHHQLKTFEGKLHQGTLMVKAQQEKLSELQARLHNLEQGEEHGDNLWRLSEIEHLTHLANLSLRYQHNSRAAVQLLELAYQQIQSMPETKYITLQQSLADLMTQLKALPIVDQRNVIIKLQALVNQLPLLPIPTAAQPQQKKNTETTNNYDIAKLSLKDWRLALEDTWSKLKELIIIRKVDKGTIPFIAPDQALYLQHSIQFELQKAQWAVIQHQNEIFHASIQQAADWIKQYYGEESVQLKSIMAELNKLNKENLEPSFPDFDSLRQQIHQALANP